MVNCIHAKPRSARHGPTCVIGECGGNPSNGYCNEICAKRVAAANPPPEPAKPRGHNPAGNNRKIITIPGPVKIWVDRRAISANLLDSGARPEWLAQAKRGGIIPAYVVTWNGPTRTHRGQSPAVYLVAECEVSAEVAAE